MDMAAMDMARGLLSPDMAMAVATPLSTRAALTTTDPMATTSTTPTARGLLSLAMDMGIMEELPAISMSPAPTLIMELESPTPTEKRASRTVRLRLYLLQDCYLILLNKMYQIKTSKFYKMTHFWLSNPAQPTNSYSG